MAGDELFGALPAQARLQADAAARSAAAVPARARSDRTAGDGYRQPDRAGSSGAGDLGSTWRGSI